MDTDIADTVLTFDVSGGGHITFLDQIDGGDVNDTGTEINYDKQYSIVLKGNGSGTGKGNIFSPTPSTTLLPSPPTTST